MNFEQQLKQFAGAYSSRGYQVVLHPGPHDLPDFAKDFKVEILGRRGDGNVLVSVKKNRLVMAADKELPRYAEIIGEQPGWRYDLAILEGEPPRARELGDAQELSREDVARALAEAEKLVGEGHVRAAFVTAWAALKASMRMRLRSMGQRADWGKLPQETFTELYSLGVLDGSELANLEKLSQVRNQIVHGFNSPTTEGTMVAFIAGLARRLVEESQPAKQTA